MSTPSSSDVRSSVGSADNDQLRKTTKSIFNVCLINARSVIQKLESLEETLNELETDVAVITETWLRNELENVNENIQDFIDSTNFSIIRRDRGNQRRGGGVAVLFDRTKSEMSRVLRSQIPI